MIYRNMITLNLNGISLENEIVLKSRFYPWWEPSLNLNNFLDISLIKNSKVIITTRIDNFLDFWNLLSLLSSLKQLSCIVEYLIIPYFPGWRQDKIEEGLPYTLELYRDILSEFKINNIITFDLHSNKAFNILKEKFNITNISNFDIWKEEIKKESINNLIILWPDKWSESKLKEYKDILWINVYFWNKLREQGKVKKIEIDSTQFNNNSEIIIIDDICDWGATVIELAKKLSNFNLKLFVTHGIFSKGFEELNKYFKEIKTTNSKNSNITMLDSVDLKKLIHKIISN